jgi:hypothetical protein
MALSVFEWPSASATQLDSFEDKTWRGFRDLADVYEDQLPACPTKRIGFGLHLGNIVQGGAP